MRFWSIAGYPMPIPFRFYLAPVLLGVCAASMLVGCTTPEEQAAADRQTCGNYGYTQGTDAFANCMMKADTQRKKAAADWQAEQNRKWDAKTADPAMQDCQTTESVDVQGDAAAGGETTRTNSRTVCVGQ